MDIMFNITIFKIFHFLKIYKINDLIRKYCFGEKLQTIYDDNYICIIYILINRYDLTNKFNK